MNPEATKIRVLVLEDDADDYRLIARQLSAAGSIFDVQWVHTLEEASQLFSEEEFDVIVTDLTIPDSVGLETVSTLRAISATTPILVLTSLEDESMESNILSAGAQDYLLKGELAGRTVKRAILHAVQRQRSLNEVTNLVAELKESQGMMTQQARLLKRKNRRLKQLYKTAQEFVDNVSHDFRTPLTVIIDYVALIREGLAGEVNEEQKRMLTKVSVRADDLNNMVDDLLDVSRIESGLLGAWRRNVDPTEIIRHAESLLLPRAFAKQISFFVNCEPDLPEVYCDAEKVGRVITNLAVNAIKFTPEGGRVELWAKADHEKRELVIGVTDTGPGIDAESLEKLFLRFKQLDQGVKESAKGFGLGLNIAQRLAKLNLGELNVTSKVDEGSEFSFGIPFALPTEVMRRWLEFRRSSKDSLQLIEITIDDRVPAPVPKEFDSFLNCLLRIDDLLLRIDTNRWLLVMTAFPTESDEWFRRAKKEYDKHSRNRPMGPLPAYHAETICQWSSHESVAKILKRFDALLLESPTANSIG